MLSLQFISQNELLVQIECKVSKVHLVLMIFSCDELTDSVMLSLFKDL